MRPAWGGALGCLSTIASGQRQRPCADAAAGRAVHRLAISRIAADDCAAAGCGVSRQPQAGAAADAPNGHRGTRAEAEDDETRARAQDLPIPAAQPGDRPAEPGVGGRHHLPPDRARVPLPGGGDRLGEPGGAGVAAVEHDGYFVLHRRARGSIGPLWQARNLQHRSRQPVHQRRLHRRTRGGRGSDLDGWARPMDGQRLHRAVWRSLKYEDIYLKGYADGHEARHGIADCVTFYNPRRPHQALAYQTPMAIWRDGITGALGQGAVDMTLRLDNAGALPTSPQPPQQPKVLVA